MEKQNIESLKGKVVAFSSKSAQSLKLFDSNHVYKIDSDSALAYAYNLDVDTKITHEDRGLELCVCFKKENYPLPAFIKEDEVGPLSIREANQEEKSSLLEAFNAGSAQFKYDFLYKDKIVAALKTQ